MRHRVPLTLCLFLVAAVGAFSSFLVRPPRASSHGAEAPRPDRRQLVNLTRPERDAVSAEMRQMLASVDGVVRGLSGGDRSAVEKAARASGMATAVDPHLERKLPKAFLAMGTRVHEGFDGIADAAKSGAGTDALLGKLSEVTGTCVACHAVYRFAGSR